MTECLKPINLSPELRLFPEASKWPLNCSQSPESLCTMIEDRIIREDIVGYCSSTVINIDKPTVRNTSVRNGENRDDP